MTRSRALPRIASAAIALCAIAMAIGALAWACTPSATIDLNGADAGPPGSSFTVNGQGFGASATITIFFAGTPVGSAQSSPDGIFTTTATVPASATPGHHTVEARNAQGLAGASYLVTGGPEPSPTPGTPPADSGPRNAPDGPASSGSRGTVSAPGVSSGRTSGGSGSAGGSERVGADGGEGARASERADVPGSGPRLLTTGSGASVFADSIGGSVAGAGDSLATGIRPSQRSASGDLWGGFTSKRDSTPGGLDEATVPANSPGSALTVSLALAGLGLTALVAGAGATARRRGRAPAGLSSD